MNEKACYRKLRKYKYQLLSDYTVKIALCPDANIVTDFIILSSTGELFIKNKYAWDGPSGPTIDTRTFMRGSLVHDALYQLIRERYLTMENRKCADDLLEQMCREDGMCRFRSWYVHKAVRLFGKKAATPVDNKPDKVICVP